LTQLDDGGGAAADDEQYLTIYFHIRSNLFLCSSYLNIIMYSFESRLHSIKVIENYVPNNKTDG
jgi:hypothetical protein